jgi:hypothetical protein
MSSVCKIVQVYLMEGVILTVYVFTVQLRSALYKLLHTINLFLHVCKLLKGVVTRFFTSEIFTIGPHWLP